MLSRLAIPVSVVSLLSVLIASRAGAQITIENPQPDSVQSGIGLISGWACDAERIEFHISDGTRLQAAYGTYREDTREVCGDTDNGFSLLVNWNNFGQGLRVLQIFVDGEQPLNDKGHAIHLVLFGINTLGEEFLRGVSGSHTIPDFPTPGASRTLRWQQAQQNFVITADSASRPSDGGMSGEAPHILENPSPGTFQSGVGVISGWTCDAETIEISFDGGPRIQAGTGTIREDTQGVCGDTNNGFGLLYNWNHLGDGPHTVTAYADGVEFARVNVTVTTLGEEFRRGIRREVTMPDFPDFGTDVVLRWQEAQQNFAIVDARPSQALYEASPDRLALSHPDYCRDEGPCGIGQGDCDTHDECARSLLCARGVGEVYGLPGADICERPSVFFTWFTNEFHKDRGWDASDTRPWGIWGHAAAPFAYAYTFDEDGLVDEDGLAERLAIEACESEAQNLEVAPTRRINCRLSQSGGGDEYAVGMCLTQGQRLGVDVVTRSRSLPASPTTSEYYLQDPRDQIRQTCEELAAGEERHQVTLLTPELQPTCSLQLSEGVEASIAANEPIEAVCSASGAYTGRIPADWPRQ